LAIVLSVLLQLTASNTALVIFKLFLFDVLHLNVGRKHWNNEIRPGVNLDAPEEFTVSVPLMNLN
jgi:hypothetical protein